jgi:hypothetical protein
MYQAIMNGTWTGLPTNIMPAQVNKTLKNIHCLSCKLIKRNRDPTRQGDGFHAPTPGEEISVDYQGKINPPSIRGYTGFYLFKDSFTGHRHAIMVKNKTAASYLDSLQRVIIFYNSHGHTVSKIRCDAGTTEADAEVIEHLALHHKIVVDPAGVGKQSQNPMRGFVIEMLAPLSMTPGSSTRAHIPGASVAVYSVDSAVSTVALRRASMTTLFLLAV